MANTPSPFLVYAGPLMLGLAAIALAALALAIWLLVRQIRVERRYRALMQGTDGSDLQKVLERHMQELRSAMCQVQELAALVRGLESAADGHVQHLGLVRYNPFRDTGGDQSFVLAMADARGDGAIITSLHMRDTTRVYAKPLAGWNSSYPFTDEESRAIRLAQADPVVSSCR